MIHPGLPLFQAALLFFAGPLWAASLEDKIGQMLMVGFRGTAVQAGSGVAADLAQRNLGGVILYEYDGALKSRERNISGKRQLGRLTKDLKRVAKTPPFIAIDQEGGSVARLKKDRGFKEALSHAQLGRIDSEKRTRREAYRLARPLSRLGINVNFAPVVDLNLNPDGPAIGKLGRSFSKDADKVVRHARAFIEMHEKRKVITAIKHFPGHGSARSDSHHGMADVTAAWEDSELTPYRELLRGDLACTMVMTAHIFNGKLDDKLPATLSAKIIDGVLRKEMGFDGVVVSDDMQMKAISGFYGLEESVEMAVNAGVDILLFGNNLDYDPAIAEKATGIIRKLVSAGKIPKGRIEESYRRITALKKRCGVAR